VLLNVVDFTSNFDLPIYDILSFEQTEKWTTYQEGRDAIGRLCRYVEELRALSTWLQVFRVKHKRALSSTILIGRDDIFMGAFVTPHMSLDDWNLYNHACIPLYVIGEIPASHSILQELRSGTLDAQEQFRTGSFEGVHGMQNVWRTAPSYRFPQRSSVKITSRLPHSISTPRPRPVNASIHYEVHPSHAWFKPWTSYIYLDPDTALVAPTSLPWFPDWETRSFQERCHGLFAFVAPNQSNLIKELDWHPFFDVRSRSLPSGASYYQELYDTNADLWYFRRINKASWEVEAEKALFVFFYPRESLTILSSYPFPGRDPSFCCKETLHQQCRNLDSTSPRLYAWTPSSRPSSRHQWSLVDKIDSDSESDVTDDEDEPYQPADNETGNLLSPALETLQVDTIHATLPTQPVLLHQQRMQVGMQVQRNLFHPIKGNSSGGALSSEYVIPWQASSQRDSTVWPLRIAQLHGDVQAEALLDMLCDEFEMEKSDIVLVCSYTELDSTCTVDLGLRYSEDAMWIWCLLHGVQVDDRYLNVYPLGSMRGTVMGIDVGPITLRKMASRLYSLDAIQFHKPLWPQNGRFQEMVLIWKDAIAGSPEMAAHTSVLNTFKESEGLWCLLSQSADMVAGW